MDPLVKRLEEKAVPQDGTQTKTLTASDGRALRQWVKQLLVQSDLDGAMLTVYPVNSREQRIHISTQTLMEVLGLGMVGYNAQGRLSETAPLKQTALPESGAVANAGTSEEGTGENK